MSTSDDIPYIFKGDKTSRESNRLNFQHEYINLFGPPEQTHPSIPHDKLFRIADIATGTGIWLQDFAKILSKTPTPDNKPRQYVGFDISRDFFPTDHGEEFSYLQQNVMKPFPDEHHGKYDLVHVRLLIAALKEDEIPIALENVLELLAPGGYIQWDEFDFPGIELPSAPPAVRKSADELIKFCGSLGFSRDIAGTLVADLSQDSSMDQHFLSKSYWNCLRDEETRERSKDAARKWWDQAVISMWSVMFARNERGEVRSEGEVQRMVRETRGIMEEWFNEGGVPGMPVVIVCARKMEF